MAKLCNCCCFSSFAILFFVVGMVLYFCLYPKAPDIFIENAFLTRFDIASTSTETKTVDYNLTVNVKFRNFNRRSRIRYYRLRVTAFVNGQKLAWTALPVFRQGPKNTTILTAAMQGNSSVKVSKSGVGFFQTAADAGVFMMNLEVNGKKRFTTLGMPTIKDSLDTNCDSVLVPFKLNLTAPASSPATSGKGFTFKPAKCEYPQDTGG